LVGEQKKVGKGRGKGDLAGSAVHMGSGRAAEVQYDERERSRRACVCVQGGGERLQVVWVCGCIAGRCDKGRREEKAWKLERTQFPTTTTTTIITIERLCEWCTI
jgi:hypothetical protein